MLKVKIGHQETAIFVSVSSWVKISNDAKSYKTMRTSYIKVTLNVERHEYININITIRYI